MCPCSFSDTGQKGKATQGSRRADQYNGTSKRLWETPRNQIHTSVRCGVHKQQAFQRKEILGAGIVVWLVKPPPDTLALYKGTDLRPGCSTFDPLRANVPGKSSEECTGVCPLPPTWKTWRKCWLLTLAWPKEDHFTLSVSASLSPFLSL